RSVLAAAYAVSGSKCPASMLKMRVHGLIDGGVTLVQVAPPSRVTLIAPSSDPDQRINGDFGLGAIAVRQPIGLGFTDAPYFPVFAGAVQFAPRVRSPEMRDHE